MGAASSFDASLAWIQAQRGMIHQTSASAVPTAFYHVKTFPGVGNVLLLTLLKGFERDLHEQTDDPLCPAHGLWGACSMHFSKSIGEKSLLKSEDPPQMMKMFFGTNDALFELIGHPIEHRIESLSNSGGCVIHRRVLRSFP